MQASAKLKAKFVLKMPCVVYLFIFARFGCSTPGVLSTAHGWFKPLVNNLLATSQEFEQAIDRVLQADFVWGTQSGM